MVSSMVRFLVRRVWLLMQRYTHRRGVPPLPTPATLRDMRTVTATRYVTPLREGGSLPGLMEADDDGLYVVKFRGAGQGPKALVAELIAGELGAAPGTARPGDRVRRRRSAARTGRAGPRGPRTARSQPGPEPRARLPAGRARPSARGRAASRARRSPRPIVWFDALVTNVDRTAKNTEPARLAPAALADRPRRGALRPAHVARCRRPRPTRLRADPRPRAAAVRRLRSRRPTSGWHRCVTRRGARGDRRARPRCLARWSPARSRPPPTSRGAGARYVDYLLRRLAAPRPFVEEADRARAA